MELKFEKSYLLDTQYGTSKHFIVVGAGGNGGYYIPQLVRQVSIQNKLREIQRLRPHKITIIDADNVEDKNLNRQNFILRDVGENKARVLADRYGRAFGTQIDYIDNYLTSTDELAKIAKYGNGHFISVFVGAVDNNKTRKIIYDVWSKTPNSFYLDAGNEEWAGQVVLGYRSHSKSQSILPDQRRKHPQIFHLPSICDLYPEVLEAEDKLPTELSCAERAESHPQNIFTNQTAANLMMGFTNTILTAEAKNGEGLKQHAVIFDAQNMNFTTKFNKLSELKKEEPKQEKAEPVAEVQVEKVKTEKKPSKKKEEAKEGVAE